MVLDVEWTDENGARQHANIDLLVTAVGSTPEIQAPI